MRHPNGKICIPVEPCSWDAPWDASAMQRKKKDLRQSLKLIPSASQVHFEYILLITLSACMLSVVTSGLPEFAPSASQEHPKFNLVPFSCLSIPTASQVRFSVLPACLLDLIPSSASQGHPKFNLAPCSCQSIPSAFRPQFFDGIPIVHPTSRDGFASQCHCARDAASQWEDLHPREPF